MDDNRRGQAIHPIGRELVCIENRKGTEPSWRGTNVHLTIGKRYKIVGHNEEFNEVRYTVVNDMDLVSVYRIDRFKSSTNVWSGEPRKKTGDI